jgi:hypothetical protein
LIVKNIAMKIVSARRHWFQKIFFLAIGMMDSDPKVVWRRNKSRATRQGREKSLRAEINFAGICA